MRIGPWKIDPPVVLAPMAGVTDKPFRLLCRELGAGLCVSEMTTADPRLWNTPKSRSRMDHAGEPGPIAVQIAGGDPQLLAAAARHNVEQGAQIIDINMGCPVKKVCNAWAGSALLQDEALVGRILEAVVAAVDVPVTLKIRTGWSREGRNALRVARLAEQAGIAALAVHGRTRDQLFDGLAEHETAAALVQAVSIPVIVNGDIDGPERAAAVLAATGAAGVMIGRAAQGRPWIFREVAAWLARGERLAAPGPGEVLAILMRHVAALHEFHGEYRGLRIARRHIGWYCRAHPGGEALRRKINQIDSASGQLATLAEWFQPRVPAAAAA